MTINDRMQAILSHFEEVKTLTIPADVAACEAAIHAELSKIESALLGLVARFKNNDSAPKTP